MVSVQTQSITALSSVRKGTRRKLQVEIQLETSTLVPRHCAKLQYATCWTGDSPLEQEQIEVVVALCQEVSQNSCWVARSNLIGREPKINTLHKVPELSHQVLVETPV